MDRLSRRGFLVGSAAVLGARATAGATEPSPAVVNDVHSRLNPTRVLRVVQPASLEALQTVVAEARADDVPISTAGARHAAGGQQFATDAVLVDTARLNRILDFDPEGGRIEIGAGIRWPQLVDHLLHVQTGRTRQWGIVQEQGVDDISVGGSLGANAHGSGLRLAPMVGDVEALVLVDAAGQVRRCDRQTNPELFRLTIGGYGLFGIVAAARLRLAPRRILTRTVALVDLDDLVPTLEQRIADGAEYGSFQYATDETSDEYMRRGVLSSYAPAARGAARPAPKPGQWTGLWKQLAYLVHVDKRRAFRAYAGYSLSLTGRHYWSDTHQLSPYVPGYHEWLDQRLRAPRRASEVLVELYVPRSALVRFFADARRDFRADRVNLIFGSIRFIERDDETVLPWARDRYACAVFNLHVEHTPDAVARTAEVFQSLVDLALRDGGSYYLTYHRWARRDQLEACYPRVVDFLRLKRRYDPAERFQSDWYRDYRAAFAERL